MKDRHLRELVEIVGVVSIVAALLLVAWEIHQSNRIAVTEIRMRIDRGLDETHLRRATTADFAKLFPKLSAPGNHLVTATEESQIQGFAQQLLSVYYSAQVAHDNGLLDAQALGSYRSELARTLVRLPGLWPAVMTIHDSTPEMRTMPVFQPVRDLDARRLPKPQDQSSAPD